VTLTLEVGTYRWYTTCRLVMMHVSKKFHIEGKRHILVTLTLDIGTYKWNATHHLMMMRVSMNFHKILKEKGKFDI